MTPWKDLTGGRPDRERPDRRKDGPGKYVTPDEPPRSADAPDPARTWEIIKGILEEAGRISLEEAPRENPLSSESPGELGGGNREPNDRARRAILENWEAITALLGEGELLLDHSEDAPVEMGLWEMRNDHLRALGAAALHGQQALRGYNQAAILYETSLDETSLMLNQQAFEQAELERKRARWVGWLIRNRLDLKPDQREAMREFCNEQNQSIEFSRRAAHRAMGLEPPGAMGPDLLG